MNTRALRKMLLGTGAMGLSVLAFIGDATSNHGLWTMGGQVGMARATYILLFGIGYDLLKDGIHLLGADWPFKPTD